MIEQIGFLISGTVGYGRIIERYLVNYYSHTTNTLRPKQSILLFFLIWVSFAHTQIPWRIDKLGTEDGLSEGYVYAIHQDKKGFIWIGTHGGLNRYDGYGFKVFQYMPFDSTTLGDNSVFFLKEDPTTGKFWIGGSSCLNEFDPVTFVNKRYHYSSDRLEFADGIFINQREMLLACQNGVLLFNSEKKTFINIPVYDENNRAVEISRVENTAKDNKGNSMIMSKTGVFFFDSLSRTCKRSTSTSPDFSPFYQYEVFNVLQDRHGFYWIATNKKGLIRYDPVNRVLTTLQPTPPLINESLRFDVVMEDSQGSIWAGSSNGLFKVNPLAMSFEYFSHDGRQPISLSHPEINVIKEDRNHFMWIGTVGGGINKMISQNAGFKNLVLSEGKKSGNAGTYVMAIQQFGNDIWFTNIWDQVGKANIETGKITLLSKPVLPNEYSWYIEGAIIKDQSGHPVILNGENSFEIQHPTISQTTVLTKPAPGLFHIHYSKKGKAYYFVNKAVEKPFFRNDTIYGNQIFYDAEEDSAGNIWIGSSKGLVYLNSINHEITQYRHNDNDVNSISSDFVYALELDNTQTIWMAAYSGGLCSYHIPSKKFRHYNKEDGLADNIVYSIEKDEHGNLWFSTNAGISTYQVEDAVFRNYGKSDGLLNIEFNRQSSFRNDKGWIFFGGIFGIDYFHPDSILKTKSNPQLAFTSFRVFNKEYRSDKRETAPVIELKHSDRYISIEFAALDYNDQQKIQYAYRLNENSEWIKLGNQHILSFSDLTTGSHLLQVRSTNAEGVWLNNQISCTIHIQPSWWQTTWFRLLALSIILLLGIILVRSYYGRKFQKQKLAFEKQQAIERERSRIATDMHDDLGAGLTRIKFITENMIEHNGDPSLKVDVQKLRSSSNELVEKMGEIIWAMNEKNNSLEDLLFYLRSYAVDYCLENNLACDFIIPDTIPSVIIDGQTRRNVFLVLKESLHNIVKHAHAEKVTIRIDTSKNLLLTITDDGKGFSQQTISNGNGLLNMQRRAADLKGRLSVGRDRPCTVELEIPLA